MKPAHILIHVLAALPVVVLSVANMPPFVHWWSDNVSDAIVVGAWAAVLANFGITAPFNRWMLTDRYEFSHALIHSLRFSIGILLPVGVLLGYGTGIACDALGLHGAAFAVAAVVAAVVLAASLTLSFQLLAAWTHRRVEATYEAAGRW